MTEETETIGVIDFGDSTSACAEFEEKLKKFLGTTQTDLGWDVTTGLNRRTFQMTVPGEQAAMGGAAVLVWFTGPVHDVARARTTIQDAADRIHRPIRFFQPKDAEFEYRKANFFASQ